MQRMIEDYIDRFYLPESKRFKMLSADGDKLAKELAAWKEKVAAAWDGIQVLEVSTNEDLNHNNHSGQKFVTTVKIEANGLADDLGLELVVDKVHDNQEHRVDTIPFKVVAKEGNTVTFQLEDKLRDPGVFRYSYRLYPSNALLPPPSGLRIRALDLIRRFRISYLKDIRLPSGRPDVLLYV